jgi:mannose-6-phosphate isomerase-like protein (cupin superfamily)
MKIRIVIGALFVLAVASFPTTNSSMGQSEDDISFARRPVPGVRIIREKDYDKRPAFYLSSNLYTTMATERETANRFVSFHFEVTPNGGPLPHTHRNEWETFFVFGGNDVTFTVGVNPDPPFNFIEQVVPSGAVVYGSQCPVHGFRNDSGGTAQIFSFAMPGGLNKFFADSGERVKDFDAPIPPISQEEITRTAFWAEQRGDALHFLGAPPPDCPNAPMHQISSITGKNLETGGDRPRFTGPFGEQRVSLLTPEEVGKITGAMAFCGPPLLPGSSGGTVDYSYFTLPPQQSSFPPSVSSSNAFEVFYILAGTLSFQFEGKTVKAPPLTYVEIQQGVPYSIANRGQEQAESLAVSVIAPPESECLRPPLPPGGP